MTTELTPVRTVVCVLALLAPALPAAAQVCESIAALETPVVQSFDTLAVTGTSSLLPVGWAFVETGTNANATYTAGTGSTTAGDTYSLGASGSSERAFGGLLSGSLTPTVGGCFRNDAGTAINQIAVAYTGEQWRLGTAGRADRSDFQWSLDATSLTTGTWTDADTLDFASPTATGATGALDGNAAPNRSALAANLAVPLPAGAVLWIRFADFNASGADDALAVDDFSLTGRFVVSTNPSGVGAASPALVEPGDTSLLTVAVTPGSGPPSTGLAASADLGAIGGAGTQALFDDGTNGDVTAGDLVFSFLASIAPATAPGSKSLPVAITDAEGRSGSASVLLDVRAGPSTTLVISQVYGGGGNSGAPFQNDFVEVYNLGTTAVDVTGWSIQYASASGTSWQLTPLAGVIAPGRFYLVAEAAGTSCSGAPCGSPLPPPDTAGVIAMSGSSGKIALVSAAVALSGACPASASLVDLVGYGSANCSETSPTPSLSNTTAALRNGGGSVDTNDNAADFAVGAPDPRNGTGQPPRGTGSADPPSVRPGQSTLLEMAVEPGANPPSTALSVISDLSPIGGPSAQPFFDDGTNGDQTANDLIFAFQATVAADTPEGAVQLLATIADAEGRSNQAAIALMVEPALSPIHAIQGAGAISPRAGQLVATSGIVTGRKFNGFFVQTADAEADGDAATSDGLFVFTGSLPSVGPGDLVKVVGTVQEFSPAQDPASPPITEIAGGPAVTPLSNGNPLPAPVTLTAADTDPAGGFGSLERLEGMRVHVASLRVIAPTQSLSLNEPQARSTSNGVFYGVVDGVPRPFREAGIPSLDPLPGGAPCCVPRFDLNTERLRVDSDGQPGGVPLEVTAGALLSNVIGPLDFSFRSWTLLPDPATPPVVSGIGGAVPVPEPSPNEFTVGSFNLQRFFDDVDDPAIGEPVLTAAAYQDRLGKASLAVRDVLRSPDLLGVQEAEGLAALATLAARVNADAVAAGQPDPQYEAHLVEGNDVGGIDSGLLVKRARVEVVDVTQVGKTATYVNPNNGAAELLNDRPPLVARVRIQGPLGVAFPVTIVVNHLRSLNGIDDETPDGSGTAGARVRAKRRAQAEFLANLIQARQAGDAGERIVSVGDYNAFSVNDGYVDLMATIKGQPTNADQVILASPDLVDPDLVDLGDASPPAEAYSYSFDGNTQTLDHVLVNAALMRRFSRFHHARQNADFPESFRNDPGRPERLSDHDPAVAFFSFPGAPTLTLLGSNPLTVECCGAFEDPGATASDDELGDLTDQIEVTGSVDPRVPGEYTLTYSVSNGFLTTTVTRTVNVADTTPPVLTLNGASPVTLERGTPFVDPGATATDVCAGDLSGSISVSGVIDACRLGSQSLVYSVSDGSNTSAATRTVNVVDTTPPTIVSAAASPAVLWPPDHRLVPVALSVTASDACSTTPACRIVSVSSDEPVVGWGSGHTWPDWVITGDLTLKLRAERSAHGDGRSYRIRVRCRDEVGNKAWTNVTVTVPTHAPR